MSTVQFKFTGYKFSDDCNDSVGDAGSLDRSSDGGALSKRLGELMQQ